MAGGDHHAAVVAVEGGREVDHLGADHAEVDHIDSSVVEALGEGFVEIGAAEADVVADADFGCAGLIGVGSTYVVSDFGIYLRRNLAAHVVGFEASKVLTHPRLGLPESLFREALSTWH